MKLFDSPIIFIFGNDEDNSNISIFKIDDYESVRDLLFTLQYNPEMFLNILGCTSTSKYTLYFGSCRKVHELMQNKTSIGEEYLEKLKEEAREVMQWDAKAKTFIVQKSKQQLNVKEVLREAEK